MISVASIKFTRVAYELQISLVANGEVLAESTSIAAIAREVVMLGISELRLTETFSITIPTNSGTLARASAVSFDEPLAVFILISECAV